MSDFSGIPRYSLYGEPDRNAERDFLHVEAIAARSSLHNWEIQPHRHGDLVQILFAATGGGEVRCDEVHTAFRAPTLVVLPPTVVHGFRFDPGTDGYVLTVSEVFLGEILSGRMAAEIRPVLARPAVFALSDEELRIHGLVSSFQAIAQEFVWSAPARITAIASHLGLVLAALARLAATRHEQTAHLRAAEDQIFLRFRELIETAFRQHWGIGAYAARLGVSASRLTAICRRTAGRSPLAIVHARLLAEAKRDLLYTTMSVAEIGYALGFRDPAYFTRFFAKQAGQPPTEFRRAAREKLDRPSQASAEAARDYTDSQ